MELMKGKQAEQNKEINKELMKSFNTAQKVASALKIIGACLVVYDGIGLAQSVISETDAITSSCTSLGMSVALFASAALWERQMKRNREELSQAFEK